MIKCESINRSKHWHRLMLCRFETQNNRHLLKFTINMWYLFTMTHMRPFQIQLECIPKVHLISTVTSLFLNKAIHFFLLHIRHNITRYGRHEAYTDVWHMNTTWQGHASGCLYRNIRFFIMRFSATYIYSNLINVSSIY